MKKGKLITFEGCEGVGKSTQVKLLKEFLQQKNSNCVFTREPGGSHIAEEIRNIILNDKYDNMSDVCELLLYSSARAQHIADIIKPNIEKGVNVICDRYIDSTYAYQGYARNLGCEFVDKVNSLAVGEFFPAYTIFLNLSPEQAFQRKGGADQKDRLEKNGLEFHKKVYDGYLDLLEKNPQRFISIDATGSKYATHEKIVAKFVELDLI